MESPTSTSACVSCGATYARPEHLRRHILSAHSTSRPFSCSHCAQAFARRDVLLRHLKTCKNIPSTNDRGSIVDVLPRGRKRTACDSCVRQKKACSGIQPCLSCLHRKQACVFPGSCGTEREIASSSPYGVDPWLPQTAETDDIDAANKACLPNPAVVSDYHAATEDVPTQNRASLSIDVRRLEFLSNFTATNGLVSSFDCGSAEQRAMFVECLGGDRMDPHLDEALRGKTHRIIQAIRDNWDIAYRRRATRNAWSEPLELACEDFFSNERMHSHLAAYWALWHPNCPIIHRPTFSIHESLPMLLAVMALLGACLSPVVGDRESAVVWLDPVEEWVFSAPEFNDNPVQTQVYSEGDTFLHERLDALRTAYCVILLQTWEGSEIAKRRTRRSRYTDIIGVFRSVCSEDITHGDLSSYTNTTFDVTAWKAFAKREELIRTLTYVVLLDSAYVIFNNTPPRMAPGEARIALTCPEPCFQADTVQQWQECVKTWAFSELGMRQPLVYQVISMLWAECPSHADEILLRSMSSLNFFTVVHPLHVQLFHARCHPLPASQTTFIRRALDAWRKNWLERNGLVGLEEISPSLGVDCWKRLGFARYAPEFWCLADLVLNSSESMHYQQYDRNGDTAGRSLVNQLLNRYDESDMSQVHLLVDMFASINLAT